MNPEQHSYDAVIEYNLEPEIYSLRVLELFNEQLIKSEISRNIQYTSNWKQECIGLVLKILNWTN